MTRPTAQTTPVKRRCPRRLALALVALGLGVVIVAGGCANRFARDLVRGSNAGKTFDVASDSPEADWRALEVNRQLRIDVGPPSASISAWVLDPSGAATPRATVVILHGLGDNKRSFLGHAQRLTRAGYRAVLVDLRAHGRSSGEFLTYGVVEARDLKQMLDALEREGLVAGPGGVWGHSYGAAAGLQWAAIDPRVRAVVSSSTFTSMRDVVPHVTRGYVPGWLGWLHALTIQSIISRAGSVAGFDADEASPLRALAAVEIPVLFLHGGRDSFIPSSHAERLHEAARGQKRLVVLDGMEHNDPIGEAGVERVWAEARVWFERWLSDPAPATRTVATDPAAEPPGFRR